MVAIGAQLALADFASIEHYRTAWKTLRYDHPTIASAVSKGKMHYTVPNKGELQEWLTKTFLIVGGSVQGKDVLATLPSTGMGVLLLLPQTREIVFQIPHTHIDGIGAMMLLDTFLCLVKAGPGDVRFGQEYKHLSNSSAHVLVHYQARSVPTPMMQGKSGYHLPEMSLQQGVPSSHGDRVCLEKCTFTSRITSRIIQQAKYRGISVTIACHSSMIQALRSLSSGSPSDYSSLFFMNLRNHLSPNTTSPVSVHMTAIPGVIQESCCQDFLHLAHHLKEIYAGPDYETGTKGQQSPLFELDSNVSSLSRAFLSSLGIIEERIHHSLEDFWMGSGTVTADMTTFVWTFRGQLTFATWYNDRFYERDTISLFLDKMQQLLLLGLEISSPDQ